LVSENLSKAREVLTGPDHKGMTSTIDYYLKEMPGQAGYVSMFNGTNLSPKVLLNCGP